MREDEPKRAKRVERLAILICGLLFMISAGLSCKGKSSTGSSGGTAATQPPEVEDNTPAAFDERDPARTLRWVVAEMQPVRKANNEIHRKQEQERFEKVLKTAKGKKVTGWTLSISHIHSNGIEFEPFYYPSNYAAVFRQRREAANLEKKTFLPETAMADMHPEFAMKISFTNGGDTYPLSPSPWANSLKAGDKVRLFGTIQILSCNQNMYARHEAYGVSCHFETDAVVNEFK